MTFLSQRTDWSCNQTRFARGRALLLEEDSHFLGLAQYLLNLHLMHWTSVDKLSICVPKLVCRNLNKSSIVLRFASGLLRCNNKSAFDLIDDALSYYCCTYAAQLGVRMWDRKGKVQRHSNTINKYIRWISQSHVHYFSSSTCIHVHLYSTNNNVSTKR